MEHKATFRPPLKSPTGPDGGTAAQNQTLHFVARDGEQLHNRKNQAKGKFSPPYLDILGITLSSCITHFLNDII